jgi:hypothetical protein
MDKSSVFASIHCADFPLFALPGILSDCIGSDRGIWNWIDFENLLPL